MIASHRQTAARSEHCFKKWCKHFRVEVYLLLHLSTEEATSEAEAEAEAEATADAEARATHDLTLKYWHHEQHRTKRMLRDMQK